MRLKTNPELEKLLLKKPDVFVYGEAETPSPLNLSIDGYVCHLHKSKLEVAGNFRRGLAIFYRTKYRFLFTVAYSSKKYDIGSLDAPKNKQESYIILLFLCTRISPPP